MNERMTELYAKACLDARDIHPTDVEKFVPCMAEKFAELIIQECQSAVDRYIGDCIEIGSLPEYVLRNHFGGEE